MTTHGHSRRAVLAGIGGLTAATLLGEPAQAATGWPTRRLGALDATHVDPTQFLPTAQLRSWGASLDRIGLRATGSPAHQAYVRVLAKQLRATGVSNVRLESIPMRRWLATRWALSLGSTALPAPAYVPYSGVTGPEGISAPTVYIGPDMTAADILALPSIKGKIAIYEVPVVPATYAVFEAIAYPGRIYDPHGQMSPTEPYVRAWFNEMGTMLAALKAAGAIGSIGILDLSQMWSRGQYFPYDGVFRDFPSLYVDRQTGETLKRAGGSSTKATLLLQAQVETVTTANVLGVIPGASPEITMLHTHTDGTNGLEENGQNGILAAAQYLARLPRASLPRTVLVLLATGHFYNGLGTLDFLRRHAHDLVPRISTTTTVEHLGALEWLPDANGDLKPTGRHEAAAYFTSGGAAVVAADDRMVRSSSAAPAATCRPFVPNPLVLDPTKPQTLLPGLINVVTGKQPALMYPGEGTYLYSGGNLPNSNYLTGPTYLLNAGISTVDKIDFDRMRALSMALVRHTVELGAASPGAIAMPD